MIENSIYTEFLTAPNTPVLYGCIYVDTERIRLNIVRDIGQLS